MEYFLNVNCRQLFPSVAEIPADIRFKFQHELSCFPTFTILHTRRLLSLQHVNICVLSRNEAIAASAVTHSDREHSNCCSITQRPSLETSPVQVELINMQRRNVKETISKNNIVNTKTPYLLLQKFVTTNNTKLVGLPCLMLKDIRTSPVRQGITLEWRTLLINNKVEISKTNSEILRISVTLNFYIKESRKNVCCENDKEDMDGILCSAWVTTIDWVEIVQDKNKNFDFRQRDNSFHNHHQV